MLSEVCERYNTLRNGTYTGAEAFSKAMTSEDVTDRLAFAMIALAVNAKLAETGKFRAEDAETIAAAMIAKVNETLVDDAQKNYLIGFFDLLNKTDN